MRAHRLARPALGLTLVLLLLLSLPGCAAGAGAQRLVLLAQDDEGFYWENLLSGARLAAQDAGWEIFCRSFWKKCWKSRSAIRKNFYWRKSEGYR